MPYLKLETNVSIPDDKAAALLKSLSDAVVSVTGKPERVVQVAMVGGSRMLFAGSEEPNAHVEVKGISFPEESAKGMSEAICVVLQDSLNIPGERVYLAFVSYKGSMWGVNSRTY